MLNLVRHLIEGHKLQEASVVQLLQRSVIYFLPQMEHFDPIFAMYNAK